MEVAFIQEIRWRTGWEGRAWILKKEKVESIRDPYNYSLELVDDSAVNASKDSSFCRYASCEKCVVSIVINIPCVVPQFSL